MRAGIVFLLALTLYGQASWFFMSYLCGSPRWAKMSAFTASCYIALIMATWVAVGIGVVTGAVYVGTTFFGK